MRARGLLVMAATLAVACNEATRLAELPSEVTRVVVVRTHADGSETISGLLDIVDGVLPLAVEPDDTLDLWGYGEELDAMVADVPRERVSTERMHDAEVCDSTLPAARWTRHVSPDRSNSNSGSTRSRLWTARWLTEQCPPIEPARLHTSLSCAVLSCGRVTRNGCNISVDLSACVGDAIPGRILADGRVCFAPQTTSQLGVCEPTDDTPPGALGSLECDSTSSGRCRVDLYDSPVAEVLRSGQVSVADPGPFTLGPGANDLGVTAALLRRMRAIPWGEHEFLVTWWPWAAWAACRSGRDVVSTNWSRVDIEFFRVLSTGTTSPCIYDLAKTGTTSALALTRPADDRWGLSRLGVDAREEASVRLDDVVARLGEPLAMAATADGDAVVLYGAPDLFSGEHTLVVHDGQTLAPTWESTRLRGAASFLEVDGNTAWLGNVSERVIETVELGVGNYQRPYEIPKLILEPLAIGGMLLPDAAQNRELMVLLLHDVPGVLVTQPNTSTLRWISPYHRERAFVTAIGRDKGDPVVTLLSRNDQLQYQAHYVFIDPVTRTWVPGAEPLGLRVVSELVNDDRGRTWAIGPWDGLIARLPIAR